MPIKVYDLGPGNLKLGAGNLEINAQLRNCRVEASENVASTDAKPVLSGEELAGSDRVTFTYVLAGTLLQDLTAAGIIDWSWLNKGTWQVFTFIPAAAAARQVKGSVSVVPITIGGEVTGVPGRPGDNPTSDFSWRAKGPTVAAGLPTTADPTFTAVP